jgi:hypothetical protein
MLEDRQVVELRVVLVLLSVAVRCETVEKAISQPEEDWTDGFDKLQEASRVMTLCLDLMIQASNLAS